MCKRVWEGGGGGGWGGRNEGRACARPLKNILASFLRKADRDRRNRQYGIAGADVDRRDLQTFDWGSAISW